jgi:hypothetical protein
VVSAFVLIDEVLQKERDVTALQVAALAQFLGNVARDVFGPLFRGIEADDADGVLILPFEHIHDDRFEVGPLYIGLSVSPPVTPEIIHNDVDVLIVSIGDDRRGPACSRHTQYSHNAIQPRLKRNSADSFRGAEHGI